MTKDDSKAAAAGLRFQKLYDDKVGLIGRKNLPKSRLEMELIGGAYPYLNVSLRSNAMSTKWSTADVWLQHCATEQDFHVALAALIERMVDLQGRNYGDNHDASSIISEAFEVLRVNKKAMAVSKSTT